MNRWTGARFAIAASLILPLSISLAPAPAAAQMNVVREAPRDVTLARMKVVATPQIEIDGKPDRLSPGARIRDVRNFGVLPGSLTGQTVPVVYKREATTGLVHEVWLLTDAEYAQLAKAKGTTPSEGVQQFLAVLASLWAARR